MTWEIYNCKERFGYTYLWTSNKEVQNILFAYCEGRSYLWNLFFGWRRTYYDDSMFFWIPSRKLERLINLSKKTLDTVWKI